MRHTKHHKKNGAWTPVLVIILLVILLGAESYFLFFHNQPHDAPSNKTAQTTTSPAALPLTHDAQQARNFNQEVLPTSEVAKRIDQKLTDDQFIGTALVIQKGQIVLQKGFGYANFEKKQPNTYHSLFQIGSIHKALTGTLVLQQVQAGTLSLDETLDRFYPSIQDSQKITIRQLLSMNSGLYQKIKPESMMSDDAFLQFEISNATMGTYGKFKYDAINFYLLVGILEKVTGRSYRSLFDQAYVSSLHLANTCFYDDFLSAMNRTYAYEKTSNQNYGTKIADKPVLFNQEVGTGSVGMTVGDLYLFFSHLLAGQIIDKKTSDAFWTPETLDNFAGGLYSYKNYIRAHGIQEGFEPNVYISKDRQDAVLLFTNQYPKNNSYTTLGKTLFDWLGAY